MMGALTLIDQADELLSSDKLQQLFTQVNVRPEMIVWEREREFALQLLSRNEYSLKVALKDQQSLRDAIVDVSAIGISLVPSQKLAYLIPRKGKIVLDISYMGLMWIATDSGSLAAVKAELVHEADKFVMRGTFEDPIHERDPFAAPHQRGTIVGAYCVAKTHEGNFLTETMSLEEILRIRERSESYKKFTGDKTKKTPWETDFGEMAKKTVIRRAYKSWPRNKRVDDAVDHLNNKVGDSYLSDDAAPSFSLDAALDEIRRAPDLDALSKSKRRWQSTAIDSNDRASHEKVTDAARLRKRELEGRAPLSDVQDVQEKNR